MTPAGGMQPVDPLPAPDTEAARKAIQDEFLRREITVTGTDGETRFTLSKMPASKGWDIIEDIREAAQGALQLDHGGGMRAAFDTLVMALPKAFTRQLRDVMFSYVHFTNRVMVDPAPLSAPGAVETAFDLIGAEPIEIYEIFLRSLAVNFTPSYLAYLEKILAIMTSAGSPSNTGTSPPSSPPQ